MNTNKYSHKRNTTLIRKNLTLGSKLWVNKHTQNKVNYKNFIPLSYQKTFKAFEKRNNKLFSRADKSVTNAEECEEIKFQYLALKEKALGLEEKLLRNGIDTSEYKGFCTKEEVQEYIDRVQARVQEDRDSDCEIIDDDILCEIFLKCHMNPGNCIPKNGQDFSNTPICFTEEDLIKGNYEICDDESSAGSNAESSDE